MNRIRITVADPDDLLNAGEFGAGALIVVQRSSTGGGSGFSAVGDPIPIVAGTTSYTFHDSSGPSGAWYRTRYSNAGGSVFSDFSPEEQAPTQADLLGVTELRALVESGLDDSALQLLLDATAQEISGRAGASGTRTERVPGDASVVMLAREAAAITTVVERQGTLDTTLSANDYELAPSRITVRRLTTGDHPRTVWREEVDVTYVATDDSARRKSVQLGLVQLELNRNPGLTSERIGDWAESYAAAGDRDLERQDLLDSLTSDHLVFFG